MQSAKSSVETRSKDLQDFEKTVQLWETLLVLQQQEQSHYRCSDYLNDQSAASSSAAPTARSVASSDLMEEWRNKICNWMFHVVDHFGFEREIVSISVSYLDRFLSKRKVDRRTFQLVAMVALHLATKLYGPRTVEMSTLAHLCRGDYCVTHIASMEMYVLSDLSWRVHPPTPQSFSRLFLSLPPLNSGKIEKSLKVELQEQSSFFMERSVCSYFFVSRKPSSIAMASMLAVLDELAEALPDNRSALTSVRRDLLRFSNDILGETDEVEECRASQVKLSRACPLVRREACEERSRNQPGFSS